MFLLKYIWRPFVVEFRHVRNGLLIICLQNSYFCPQVSDLLISLIQKATVLNSLDSYAQKRRAMSEMMSDHNAYSGIYCLSKGEDKFIYVFSF